MTLQKLSFLVSVTEVFRDNVCCCHGIRMSNILINFTFDVGCLLLVSHCSNLFEESSRTFVRV